MKYVLLIAIIWVAYMLWRKSQAAASSQDPGAQAQPGRPQDMICCPVCSVHLPRGDAVADADGRLYCSQEHRLRRSGG